MNDKVCQQFIQAILEIELRDLKKEIEETKFLAVISDEPIDVFIKENEAVYLRWCTRGIKALFNCLHCDDTTVPNYTKKL